MSYDDKGRGKKKKNTYYIFSFPLDIVCWSTTKNTAGNLFFIHKDTAHDCIFIYGVHNGQ